MILTKKQKFNQRVDYTEYKKIMYDKAIKEMEKAWELEKIKRRNENETRSKS